MPSTTHHSSGFRRFVIVCGGTWVVSFLRLLCYLSWNYYSCTGRVDVLGYHVNWRARIVIADDRLISCGESVADTSILQHLVPPLYVMNLVNSSPLLLFNNLLGLLIKMIVVLKFVRRLTTHVIQIGKWRLRKLARGAALPHLLDWTRRDHSLLLVIEVSTQGTVHRCSCWRTLPCNRHALSC